MKNRQLDDRLRRLETNRQHADGWRPSRRSELIRELMRELSQPQGDESIVQAWCRRIGADYEELRRRSVVRDPDDVREFVIEPLAAIVSTEELSATARGLVAELVELQHHEHKPQHAARSNGHNGHNGNGGISP